MPCRVCTRFEDICQNKCDGQTQGLPFGLNARRVFWFKPSVGAMYETASRAVMLKLHQIELQFPLTDAEVRWIPQEYREAILRTYEVLRTHSKGDTA